MQIKRIIVGFLEANCYVLSHNNKCLVIDPGDDYLKIKEAIGKDKIVGILITHNHSDHINALRNILGKSNIPIFKKSSVTEDCYDLNDFKFEVILTPGHSSDSISFYFPESKDLFTGDFLFQQTIGRYDLPTGSLSDMKSSLSKLKKMTPDISIYPGHGNETTLSYELKYNPYLSEGSDK